MDGQNYLVFHNDGNDSYMNSSANFRGADVGALFIDVYFKAAAVGNAGTSAGYDKVRLTVTTAYDFYISSSADGKIAVNKAYTDGVGINIDKADDVVIKYVLSVT